MGKYLRHAIGAAVAAALAALIAALGLDIDPDAVGTMSDALATGVYLFVTLIGYAWTEKFLKRFGKLDPEGQAERLHRKELARRARSGARL